MNANGFRPLLLSLLLAAPVHAFTGGIPLPIANSGFVMVRGAGANCTAVALTPDLLITAKACIEGDEVQHPELLGWFMGEQDSDDNPVREVAFDAANLFALLRLSKPLVMNGKGVPLYGGEDAALTDLRCVSFGPVLPVPYFAYGDMLAFQDFHVIGMIAGGFETFPVPLLHPLDIGGACFRAGTDELAGLFVPTQPAPFFGGIIVGIARARAFITEFRATFEVVAAQSGLCLGNVPNGTHVWQLPCIAGGQPGRVNQEWSLRRHGNHFMIRPARFPELCLGAAPGNRGEGAPIVFFGCPPPLINGSSPWLLPSEPRADQLWDIAQTSGDGLELQNVGTRKCLDVPGNSRLAGTVLTQSTCHSGGVNQRFFINVDRFEGGTHRLASFADPLQCIDVAGGATADGTPILGFDCHGGENQQFELLRDGTTHNQLIARGLGSLGLSCVSGPAPAAGTALVQLQCAPGLGQEWLFRWLPNGIGYRLHSRRDANQCLTRPAGAPSGAPLVEALCSGEAASQRWIAQ